jgi:hypothetical protein
LLSWFVPQEQIRFSSQAIWLSQKIWLVKDRFEFSSGRILERKMFAEVVGPDRLHVTADDMPLGADIQLSETGFRFTPYYALASHRGRVYRLRCFDECTLDAQGRIHDVIQMYWCGCPVARMHLGPLAKQKGQTT